MSVDDRCDQLLREGVTALGLQLDEAQLQKLGGLLVLLQKWGAVYNLTAIHEPREIVIKHFLDSLSIAPLLTWQSYLDVGCGAGFPCLPLAIACPDKRFIGLDCNGKKIRFVQKAINYLGLHNCEAVQQRIEDFKVDEVPEAIICRAFASLADTISLCAPLLAKQRVLLAMKGKIAATEIEALPEQMRIERIESLLVPGLDAERHLVVVQCS